ncbi:MAG TPA: pseudouridine-5'-phosphate glycosidase [Gaiellaceae bacterium]|nr:pseudouridine-5'-phosphate glycosidase [Gaiellaceae bacterium]
MIELAEGIEEAIEADGPVVALETTLVAHGFPAGQGVAVGRASEAAVRSAGAVPATVGVLDGAVQVGLADAELERFDARARKVGPSTIAAAVAAREVGATTVGGTLVACRAAGIRVLATGGIGGVHRGWDRNPDVSGDLAELARTPAVVVCSGVKSLLDVPATVELLETLGVPVVGWQTDSLPLFYWGDGGPPLTDRVDSPAQAAAIARAHWALGGAAILLVQPPPSEFDAEPLIEEALAAAESEGVHGAAVTPFVLARLHERSQGATLAVNRDLITANALLAGQVAVALAS